MITLRHPEILELGLRQEWFSEPGYVTGAACGATTGANLLRYYIRSRGISLPGYPGGLAGKDETYRFMKEVYGYLTPQVNGLMAVPFCDEMRRLTTDLGLDLLIEELSIPLARKNRPSPEKLRSFIAEAITEDIPPAFLSLSNGGVYGIDTWHWTTLTAIDETTTKCRIQDNSHIFNTDIGSWLTKTRIGGSIVRLREACFNDIMK